jgi:hypothetical protein
LNTVCPTCGASYRWKLQDEWSTFEKRIYQQFGTVPVEQLTKRDMLMIENDKLRRKVAKLEKEVSDLGWEINPDRMGK